MHALEGLDRIGVLGAFVPEWNAVRCRPQRDPYHRYSVDVHLLEALAGMSRLLEGEDSDPMVAQAKAVVGHVDSLLLGALFHDIGKIGEGGHVAVGARIAATALDRMRLPESTRDLALFMVEEHLLLSDTATRRDLQDDDLVFDVAAKVGNPERLAALYLLAIADAGATGPLAWTPWRATLVRELVAKVQRVLERGEMGAETAERLTARADELRESLPDAEPAAVDRFLLRMPRSYFLGLPIEKIVEHYPLIGPPLSTLEVRTLSGPGARPGTYSLTVVAADRPGLLSWIAGALSLAGLSILTAHVFTTEDGAAVDVFEVEGAFEPEVTEERWREFRSTLRKAIEGRLSLEYRVAEKRKHYPPPRSHTPVKVTVDNDASDFFTVIEVGAPDRIGLLFDITRTLSELQLDVHLAKVATLRGPRHRRLLRPRRARSQDRGLRAGRRGAPGHRGSGRLERRFETFCHVRPGGPAKVARAHPRPAWEDGPMAEPYYRADLARIHHLGFAFHANDTAPGILALIEPVLGGVVVELGCGSGLLTRHLVDAGHRVIATDASPAMLDLARGVAADAEEIRQLTLPDDSIPEADAIVSVGHVLSYLDDAAQVDRLSSRPPKRCGPTACSRSTSATSSTPRVGANGAARGLSGKTGR